MSLRQKRPKIRPLKDAEPGDLIEFPRSNYSHWAVFVGNDFVIHRWGEGDGVGNSMGFWGNVTTLVGREFNKATVMRTTIQDVLRYGEKAHVHNALDDTKEPLPACVILERATNGLDQIGYNLIWKNCEHFATDCRYGEPLSLQVQKVATRAMIGALCVSALGLAAAYVSRGSSQTPEDNEDDKQSNSPGTRRRAIQN